MIKDLNSCNNLFAEYAKIKKIIKNEDDFKELQKDIDQIHVWSQRWKLELNEKKKLMEKKVKRDFHGTTKWEERH